MENQIRENNQCRTNDFWQADISGKIYETNISEMSQWITEGVMMPMDKVCRGNLRWLDAGKVPPLMPFFNARENDLPPPIIPESKTKLLEIKKCTIHPDADAVFCCEACFSNFCGDCSDLIKESKNFCSMCGAFCNLPVSIQSEKSTSDFSQNNRLKDFDSPTTNQIQPNYPAMPLPSDVLNAPKKKGLGMFFVILFSLSVSGIGAYLWAYQFAVPDQTVEDALPKIVELDKQQKAEIEKYEKIDADIAAKKVKDANLKKINETSLDSGGLSGCYNSTGKSIECDESLTKINKAFADRSNDIAKSINKRQEAVKIAAESGFNMTGFALPFKEKYAKDRAKIIEDYRTEQSRKSFFKIFFISFFAFFGGMALIRKLVNR